MYSVSPPTPEAPRPFLTWQSIIDWSQKHYRCRTFTKDEPIPVRSGLLYLVQCGLVRLASSSDLSASQLLKRAVRETAESVPKGRRSASANGGGTAKVEADHVQAEPEEDSLLEAEVEEAFLGFVGAGSPFEVVSQAPFSLNAYAHTDQTTVMWMYWSDLDNWPHFRREVLDAFRYQHQRKLLLLSALGQRRTVDRLLGFLTLLIEEYGEPSDHGYCLPWPLTHAQIGSAIGATRVTVTRLMGRLRQHKLIHIQGDNQICFASERLSNL